MDEKFQRELLARLDILIALELDREPTVPRPTMTSKIQRLLDLGLSPSQAAGVVGKSVNYVTASQATKRARQKARSGD